MHDDMTPPSPYDRDLAELRAAEAADETQETPEQLFERRYGNMRARQLEREQAQLDRDAAEDLRALADHRRTVKDDLRRYEVEDPYAADLAKMRAEDLAKRSAKR